MIPLVIHPTLIRELGLKSGDKVLGCDFVASEAFPMITFTVQGHPKAQPRTRRSRSGGVYTPATAEGWKYALWIKARENAPAEPLKGPVRLNLDFVMPRPKSHYGTGKNADVIKPKAPAWPAGTPDLDNLEKAAMDVLTETGFWRDDCQVVDKRGSKCYEEPGLPAGLEVLVEPM